MEGQYNRYESKHRRRIIENLCDKYDCEVEELRDHCFIFRGINKQIKLMMKEKEKHE